MAAAFRRLLRNRFVFDNPLTRVEGIPFVGVKNTFWIKMDVELILYEILYKGEFHKNRSQRRF